MAKFRKTLYVSLMVGFIFSLVLWLVIIISGQIMPGGQSAFVAQVHHLQQPGLNIAHSWFPCADPVDAANQNCESIKLILATVFVNMLLYAGLLFIPIYIFRLFSTSLD